MRIKQISVYIKSVLNVINISYILILVNATLGIASVINGTYLMAACCFLWAFSIYHFSHPFFRKDNLVMLNKNYFDQDNEIHLNILYSIGKVKSVFSDHVYVEWPCYDNLMKMPKYALLKINI